MNVVIFVVFKFRTKLLATNNLIKRERTTFYTEEKYRTFLLAVMKLVSSANNIGSDREFILRGSSFIYIMNKRVPRLDTSEISCLNLPRAEKRILS
jgi:hypothetical protein